MKKMILFASLALCSTGLLGNQLYTWIDDEGIQHYSAKPPQEYPYEEIGAANEVFLDPATLAAMERARAEAEAEKSEAEDTRPEREEDPEETARACAELTDQMEVFQQRIAEQAPEEDAEDEEALQAHAQRLSAMEQMQGIFQMHCG